MYIKNIYCACNKSHLMFLSFNKSICFHSDFWLFDRLWSLFIFITSFITILIYSLDWKFIYYWLLMKLKNLLHYISSCKSLNNKKTVPAFMNSSVWQRSYNTARAVSDGNKSANNLLSLSFSSCNCNHVARFMNASVGWFGTRHYVSPNYCYVI